MRSALPAVAACLSAVLWALPAGGTVYHVSPGGPITSLKAIVNSLGPGDVVEVEPGTYNEVMRVLCNGTVSNPITIRGVGATRPIFDATGLNVSGSLPNPRAVFQIEGANIILENIEMRNARNGNNGSGVRMLNSTNAVVRNCKISYCDMGMMGGDNNRALVEGCDIGFNGTASYNGYSHNMYMGDTGDMIVRGCYIHDALYGQNFKSRAHYNELWYNWIADSNEGEVCGVDAAETEVPNSNLLMVGNVVVSKAGRTGNGTKYINFGADMSSRHNGTAYIFSNTLIAGESRNQFINITDYNDETYVVARNNVFYGSNNILGYWWNTYDNHQGSHNWMPTSAAVPTNFTNTVKGSSPGFLNAAARDYRLLGSSAAINAGCNPADMWYVDGDGVTHSLAVGESYLFGQGLFPRLPNGQIDIGAYEYIAAPVLSGDATFDGEVDGADYTIWADNFGTTGAAPWYNGGWSVGNFNDDFVVDGADYTVWADHYKAGGGADAAAVPEPAALMLLAAIAPLLNRRRRAR